MAENNIVDNSLLQAPTNVLAGATVAEPQPVEPPQDVTPDEPVVVTPEVGEPVGDVTVISDKEAQEKTDENLAKLEADIAKAEPEPLEIEGFGVVGAGEGVFRDPNTGQLQRFSNVDINAENILNKNLEFVAGQDISPIVRETQEAKRKGLTREELSKLGVTTPEEDELKKAKEERDASRQEAVRQYDEQRKLATASGKALIDSIVASFDIRERQLESTNKNALETLRILGIRSGRQRFAGEIQTGIISSEERAGIQRLADLDVQEKSLIAQAQQAATDKDFELLNAQRALIDGIQTEKIDELEAQLKITKELEAEAEAKFTKASRDSAVAGLLAQGVTNPTQLLDFLNFDEKGNQIGDFTVEEITETLDKLQTEQLKSTDTEFIKLANGNTELRNKITGDLIREIGGAKIETTGGNREDLDSFQLLQARDLSAKIFGKRAGSKPENYGLIEDLLVRGMTADEIGDKLRFSEQSEAFEGSFKSAFEFVTKSGFTTADRLASRDGLDELLEDEDVAGAREFMLGLARDKADATSKQQVIGREDLVVAINSIEAGLKKLKDDGIDTGFLTGLKEKALEKGGFTVGDGEQNAIANEIAIAIIDYRKAVSGAAFTESEAAAYDKVFPSSGKTSELNQAKVNSIRRIAEDRLDSFYKRSLGTSFDEIMGVTPEQTQVTEEITLETAQTGQIVELLDGTHVKKLEDGRFEEI